MTEELINLVGYPVPLVSAAWLHAHRDDPTVRVLDCRWYLRPFDDRNGDDEYAVAHIPGALHVRWDTELADPTRPANMAAGPERFAAAMSALGIGDDTFVVTYDDHHVPVASRVWWLLRLYGHERVAVLDGGFPGWVDAGLPTSDTTPTVEPASFTPHFQPARYATKADVLAALDRGDTTLVDARMDVAYSSASGTIPGARRLPGLGFLTHDRRWREPDEARRLIEAVTTGDEPVIAFCGGGVAATGTALAFELAGLGPVAVYDGSWTEWESDPETPKQLHGNGS